VKPTADEGVADIVVIVVINAKGLANPVETESFRSQGLRSIPLMLKTRYPAGLMQPVRTRSARQAGLQQLCLMRLIVDGGL
jgi:hypothetical protein